MFKLLLFSVFVISAHTQEGDFAIKTKYTGPPDPIWSNKLWQSLQIDRMLAIYVEMFESVGNETSGSCLEEAKLFLEDFKRTEEWACKMYDANSKIQSGLLSGNLANLGHFEQCLSIEQSQYCHLAIELPSLHLVTFPEDKPLGRKRHVIEYDYDQQVIITWGICLPSPCDIREIIEMGWVETEGVRLMITEPCMANDPGFENWEIFDFVLMFWVGLFLGVVTVSTAIDFIINPMGNGPTSRLFTIFSVRKNWNHLIKDVPRNRVGCVDGLRSLSLFWVIMYHRFDRLPMSPVMNMSSYVQWIFTFESLAVMMGKMAVETFFTIGGFLISYNYLKSKLKFNFWTYLGRRYIRLTPVIVAWIIILKLSRLFGSGPLWNHEMDSILTPCEENFWFTILYIQNYWNLESMCLHQTWYLNVDTQLYLLLGAPLIWIISRKWNKTIQAGICMLLVISLGNLYYIVQKNKFHAGVYLGTADAIQEEDNTIYYPTHARVSSWLMGFLSGYLFFKYPQREFSKVNSLIWYIIIITLQIIAILGYYYTTQPDYEYNFYWDTCFLVFHRPIWALSVVTTIFYCFRHNKGFLNKFLSWKVWVIVGKLSFSAYVVHFQWQIMVDGMLQTPQHFGFLDMVYKCVGDIFCSVILAVPLFLCVELPFINLFKLCCNLEKNKRT